MAAVAVPDFLKQLALFLYMQLLGAIQALKEQTVDRHRPLKRDVMSQDGRGKTLVMTGGNRGIGWEALKVMLPLGYHVILGCRDPDTLDMELKKLKQKNLLGDGTYEILQVNLKSLRSVEEFARAILSKNVDVDVLINNAGIMFGPRTQTDDGFESQFGVNHLSHVLLTHLLLPRLKSAGEKGGSSARIVNVSSCAHFVGCCIDFDDLQCRKFYSPEGAYGNSKAAQIMFTRSLERRLSEDGDCNVKSVAIHPGVVRTGLYEHARFIHLLGIVFMKSPDQGGDTIVYAALSPEIEGRGGLYLDNSQPGRVASFASDPANQQRMWDAQNEILGIRQFGVDDGKSRFK